MYVCMYVCIYVCMYVCMYICLYVCIYVCMYVSMYVCMDVWMYVVSTLLVLSGSIGKDFHPSLYSNGANNFASIQGIPSIQWGHGLTRRTNTL